MKKFTIITAAFILAACHGGCAGAFAYDPVPDPSTHPIPIQPIDACEQEAAEVEKLCGAPLSGVDYVENCKRLDRQLAAERQAPADHTCAIKGGEGGDAPSCKAMRACQ